MNDLETLIDSGPTSDAATLRNGRMATGNRAPLANADLEATFDALTHSTVGKTELASEHMGQDQELKDEVHEL